LRLPLRPSAFLHNEAATAYFLGTASRIKRREAAQNAPKPGVKPGLRPEPGLLGNWHGPCKTFPQEIRRLPGGAIKP